MKPWIVVMSLLAAAPAEAKTIVSAAYVEPTGIYGHGAVAGGEYAGLRVVYDDGSENTIRYNGAVFEDTAPRLFDFDDDGSPEVVAVFSGLEVGAMMQVIGLVGDTLTPLGQTTAYGQPHRWLAIAGIADINGDGLAEVAYVDRPHLAKVLRLMTVERNGAALSLTPLGEVAGLTNHQFGSANIEGGIRECPGEPPVIVTADGDWARVMETRWELGRLATEAVGPYTGPESLTATLSCD